MEPLNSVWAKVRENFKLCDHQIHFREGIASKVTKWDNTADSMSQCANCLLKSNFTHKIFFDERWWVLYKKVFIFDTISRNFRQNFHFLNSQIGGSDLRQPLF